jgi:hypothetical protein
MTTDVTEFITDLDGGVFVQKIAEALSDVAAGVVDHAKKGKVVLSFSIARVGNSHQVTVEHELSYKKPTARGEASETNKTQTGMWVGPRGALALFQPNQNQMFDRSGQAITGDKS